MASRPIADDKRYCLVDQITNGGARRAVACSVMHVARPPQRETDYFFAYVLGPRGDNQRLPSDLDDANPSNGECPVVDAGGAIVHGAYVDVPEGGGLMVQLLGAPPGALRPGVLRRFYGERDQVVRDAAQANTAAANVMRAHFERFRHVADDYPRMVTTAYGTDVERAALDDDETVATTVAAWKRRESIRERESRRRLRQLLGADYEP